MVEARKIYDNIAEEMDGIELKDLPDEKDFARNIVKVLEVEEAMKAIREYTRYVCNRQYPAPEPNDKL